MDPDATLTELRELSARALVEELPRADVERMGELVAALDGWLERGGFLPAAWQPE